LYLAFLLINYLTFPNTFVDTRVYHVLNTKEVTLTEQL